MKAVSDLLQMHDRLEQSGETAALATIVEVRGSHYSPVGACMIISASGETAGNVSGGCLRAELIERGRAVLQDGKPELATFDTTSENDLLLGSGMGCGGTVSILIEPTRSETARQYLRLLKECERSRNHTAVATVYATEGDTDLSPGDRFFLIDDQTVSRDNSVHTIESHIHPHLAAALLSAASTNKTYSLPNAKARVFIEYIQPSRSIAIFGASDDVIPVCKFANILGWQVTIIDPRAELLTSDRFSGAYELITAHPNDPRCFSSTKSYDAAVVMTHNYLRDLGLLRRLLASKLRYIGLLGAAKRVDKLITELNGDGVDISSESLNNLYAPVGLDIGAESPSEIALSIVAEIQTVLSGHAGQSLRENRSHNLERPTLRTLRILSKEETR